MNFFKRSKAKEFMESLHKADIVAIPPDDTFPEVIKESVLKPTKCGGCHSIYQAKPKHIKGDPFHHYERKTICPICGYYNAVEFEEADDEQR